MSRPNSKLRVVETSVIHFPFDLTAVLTLFVVAAAVSPALAITRTWIAGSGNWHTPGNWSSSLVPDTMEDASISFTDGASRTINYDGGSSPALESLLINLTNFGATSNTTTLSIAANNLSTRHEKIGTTGRATVNQTGGTHTVGINNLEIGSGVGSEGVYNLSGTGTLNLFGHEYVGAGGKGTFNQSGGTHTISSDKILDVGLAATGTGTYNLSGGTLSAGSEYIGDGGTGKFIQTGGTNNVTNELLWIGYGNVGEYSLSGGTLNTPLVRVGRNAVGTFNHSGGTLNINSTTGTAMAIGISPNGGSYNISGSAKAVLNGNLFVTGLGTYTQTGGSVVALDVAVGSTEGEGHFDMSGGSFAVGAGKSLTVGLSFPGRFNMSGGTFVLTSGDMSLNTSATVNHSGGAIVGNGDLFVGGLVGSNGTYNLTGGSATFNNAYLGLTGAASLNVGSTGLLNITSQLRAFDGDSITLSGGRINTAYLGLNPTSHFNWTAGTLNITSDTIFDSLIDPQFTGGAFGAALTLGADRTLMITGNETLGDFGPFALTLNSGSSHIVTSSLTIKPNGTLNQSGGTLYANTIVQAGGTVNGLLQNQNQFIYQSGLFNGSLQNQGSVTFGPFFSVAGVIYNEGQMGATLGQTIQAQEIQNYGDFTLDGGVLTTTAHVINQPNGYMRAHGTINHGVIYSFTNLGTLELDGLLKSNSRAYNYGTLRGNGTLFANFQNYPGGVIQLEPSNSINISHNGPVPWHNFGLISLSGGTLAGAEFENNDTIQGVGTINAKITNAGFIRAEGGQLLFGVAGSSNFTTGVIQIPSGSSVVVTQGLTQNQGTIALTGGSFQNGNHPLPNSGIISGFGTVQSSALTNTGFINGGAGDLSIFGPVTNNGVVGIQSGKSIYFYGNVNGGGDFAGPGTATFLAGLSPGNSPATASFEGNANLSAASVLTIEIGGLSAGTQFDKLDVEGTLTLGGILHVDLINGFAPALTQSFDILDWGSRIGTFASLQLPALAGGLGWNTDQLYTNGTLSIVSYVLAGDYNHDGFVDQRDYVLWRKTNINGAQGYTIWKNHYGESTGGSGGITVPDAPVPEPTTTTLLAFVAITAFIAPIRARSASKGGSNVRSKM